MKDSVVKHSSLVILLGLVCWMASAMVCAVYTKINWAVWVFVVGLLTLWSYREFLKEEVRLSKKSSIYSDRWNRVLALVIAVFAMFVGMFVFSLRWVEIIGIVSTITWIAYLSDTPGSRVSCHAHRVCGQLFVSSITAVFCLALYSLLIRQLF